MDSAPGRAQGGDMLGQLGFDLRQLARLETDRFAQGRRTGRTVQVENGFAVAADDVERALADDRSDRSPRDRRRSGGRSA